MRYNLAELAKRSRPGSRRRQIVIRDVVPPATLAGSLYRECFAPIIALWAEALPGIEAEYARSLAQMVTDSADDLQSRLDAEQGAFDRLVLTLTARLRDWTLRTERWHRGRWRGAALSATGVDVGTMMGPEPVRQPMDAFIRRNVALIKDVNAQAQGRIADAVFRGLSQRRPAADVAREIRAAVGMGRARARRIAADQLVKIANTLAEERRREAGIERWQWVHSGKLHAREEHEARDGNVYSDKDAPEDMPGELPFCGCRSRAVLDLD